MIDTETLLGRNMLSGLAWRKARWEDGRRVIIHNCHGGHAVAEPSPLTRKEQALPHVSMYQWEYTWERVASELLKLHPRFGPSTGS